MKKSITAILMLIVILVMPVTFAATYPKHTRDFYVNDFAEVLSSETEQMIIKTSAALSEASGAQIVVVTIDSLDGQDIESYSTGLFREWGIGDEKKNNGLLLLVAIDDRRSRIEVGYGLEGALNDAKTGRIQDEYLIGHFQAGDYDAGITGTYLKLAEEVYMEYDLNVDDLQSSKAYYNPVETKSDSEFTIFHLLIGIIVFILMILDMIFNRGRLTRLALYALARGSKGSSRGGGFGGGGGRSGGGGSSRSW